MNNAPGKHYRKGMSITELFRLFPDDKAAEKAFEKERWPDGVRCGHCQSKRVSKSKHPTMPYNCLDCSKHFSVKTGTVMQSSRIGYQKWAIAIYMMVTNLKGVSSMRLHRELGITQKSAWHLNHRIRECFKDNGVKWFEGPVEIDESYFGGIESRSNQQPKKDKWGLPIKKKKKAAAQGKTPVVGIKDRVTKQVYAEKTENAGKKVVFKIIDEHVNPIAKKYTDENMIYRNLPYHESVRHGINEFVRGQAHTQGIDSFWSMMKRGHKGIYHKMSPKHLDRYVKEFAERQNQRELDTHDQILDVVKGAEGKRLTYKKLIA